MKYLKRFNESIFNRISKSDISEILDILNELSDEGFEFMFARVNLIRLWIIYLYYNQLLMDYNIFL